MEDVQEFGSMAIVIRVLHDCYMDYHRIPMGIPTEIQIKMGHRRQSKVARGEVRGQLGNLGYKAAGNAGKVPCSERRDGKMP